jgi:renalase
MQDDRTELNDDPNSSYEIAIVGAGVAGLTAARALHDAGRKVIVIDKSRGLGGRLATRRLVNGHADHGVCYLSAQGQAFQSWLDSLTERGLLKRWSDRLHDFDLSPEVTARRRYVAPDGATALAKDLAQGLTIERNQLITVINPMAEGWQILAQNPAFQVTAKTVILAIPAPQALPLVEVVGDPEFVAQVRSIEFSPCVTAIALYPASRLTDAQGIQGVRGIQGGDNEILNWIGFEHTKQLAPLHPILVIQSNKRFFEQHFESSNLVPIGQQLCDRAAKILAMDWITQPEILQVHRWKYAFPVNPLAVPFLSAKTVHPLYCIGDWCGGDRVESAFYSGGAIVQRILESVTCA